MTSAKEILSTTAAEQIVSGAVELVTVRHYDRFVGAMLATDDGHRLMMEDLHADVTHLWSWTSWVDGTIGETEVTADERTARAAVTEWLAEAPHDRRDRGRDIFAVILAEEDWR